MNCLIKTFCEENFVSNIKLSSNKLTNREFAKYLKK